LSTPSTAGGTIFVTLDRYELRFCANVNYEMLIVDNQRSRDVFSYGFPGDEGEPTFDPAPGGMLFLAAHGR